MAPNNEYIKPAKRGEMEHDNASYNFLSVSDDGYHWMKYACFSNIFKIEGGHHFEKMISVSSWH